MNNYSFNVNKERLHSFVEDLLIIKGISGQGTLDFVPKSKSVK